MKVRELIEELGGYDPNLDVLIDDMAGGGLVDPILKVSKGSPDALVIWPSSLAPKPRLVTDTEVVSTSDAKTVIEEAISALHVSGVHWTDERMEALQALADAPDIAPRHVCETVGVEQGSTWGDVVAELKRGMK